MANFTWDNERVKRTGIAEAVFCTNKSDADLADIIRFNLSNETSILLTRLNEKQWFSLPKELKSKLDYDEVSKTAILSFSPSSPISSGVCIVTAGTSDLAVANEVQRTFLFNGFNAPIYADLGVAGLWRLMNKIEEIREYKIIIAIAGMEGALFSVLSGLVESPVIAVPTSVGYGVSQGGQAALTGALASCSPGILTVNIDNGFGAANAALKILNRFTSCSSGDKNDS